MSKKLVSNSHFLVWNGDPHQYAKLYEAYGRDRVKFDKKHPQKGPFCVMSLSELCDKPFPPSRVEVREEYYALHVYGLYNTYDIEKSRVRSISHLLAWIRHLSEKTWCDNRLIRDFAEAVYCSHGWKMGGMP